MYEKVIRSGSLLEHWSYERSLPEFRKRRHIQPNKGSEPPKRYRKHEARRDDNIRKTGKHFRRLVRANLVGTERPALVTLTMLQKLSLKASRRLLSQFFIRFRKRFGNNVRYIVVPEFQKRGAVHFHALIWGIKEETIKAERTTREIQRLWCAGYVDCITTDGHVKLAGYLSKYMSKSMSDVRLGGERAYDASRNVLRPMSVGTSSFSNEVKEMIGLTLTPDHIRKFKTEWLGECTYQCFTIPEN